MDDVCIIIENTHSHNFLDIPRHVLDIITGSHELTFAVVHISNKPVSGEVLVASYPPNLNTLIHVYLDNSVIYKNPTPQKRGASLMWGNIFQFYRAGLKEKKEYFEKMIDGLSSDEKRVLNMDDILFSKEMWNFITEDYNLKELKIAFLNYYRMFYLIQTPFYQLMNIIIPQARIYHAFSSMHANWLSLIAKRKYGTSLILDEREDPSDRRNMEHSVLHPSLDPHSLIVFQELQKENYHSIRYLSHLYADAIVVPYAGQQREDDEYLKEILSKMVQIQKGIDSQVDEKDKKEVIQKAKRFLIGLVGSFIPVDDIKTFIRASKIIAMEMENVDFRVIALDPIDEEYLLECINLRNNLDLALRMEIIEGEHYQDYLNNIDIFVSTSLDNKCSSFLLEAMDASIPLVATNRGRHEELIHGDGEEDSKLGECGFITDIGNPEQIAQAVMEILKDKRLKKAMGRVGKKRIETYYLKEDNLKKYNRLYKDYL